MRAIANGQTDNLILQELSSLVSACITETSQLIAAGKDPSRLQHPPTCALEKIAMGMAAVAIKTEEKENGTV